MLITIAQVLLATGMATAFSSSSVFIQRKNIVPMSAIRNIGNDDDAIDLDSKIRALNKMIGVDDKSNDILMSTSNRRKNLEREIELLSRLHPDHLMEESNPDDAENDIIQQFWSIWYGECGASNARALRAFEEELVSGGPESWLEAEREYLALIEEHCQCGDGDDLDLSLWVEPANRLATLYYMMGRLDDSKFWCERILEEAKPWHIGALSGILLVCLQNEDKEGLMKWAPKAMPRLSENTLGARKEWVERNVALAKEKLYELEEMSQNYVKTRTEVEMSVSVVKPDIEDMSWQ